MTNSPASPSLGKWLVLIVVLLIIASLLGAVALWWLLQPGSVLKPTPPTPAALTPPHAPPIENTFGAPVYAEKQLVLTVNAGQQVTLKVVELWSAPDGTEVSCATGFLAFTWMVRQPYPEGGEDLEFRRLIPQGDGRTEAFAGGSSGSATVGYCNEITLFNTSLTDYQVELRYASGILSAAPETPATEMPAPVSAEPDYWPAEPLGREHYAAINIEQGPLIPGAQFWEAYAAALQNGDAWIKDPILVGLRFTGYPNPEDLAPEKVFVFHAEPNRATVIVIAENLPDDSIKDQEYRVDVISENGAWRIEWAGYRQRCRRGDDLGWIMGLCP